MKIGIDIDDTLTNTKDIQLLYWQEYVTNHPKKGYDTNLPTTINDFGDEYVQTFWDTYREELSFNPSFKENASLVLNNLKKAGHKLCIITSRPDEKYQNLHQRLKEWFAENNIPIDIIYTNIRDKGSFCKDNNIDLFIDDDLKHIIKANSYNIKTILFNQNNKYDGLQSTNWLELYKIIKKIEKEELDQ